VTSTPLPCLLMTPERFLQQIEDRSPLRGQSLPQISGRRLQKRGDRVISAERLAS
jgi:hypothetical protein